MKFGLVGIPNVGKSSIFNSFSKKQQAQVANYPFCTIDPNVAVVDIPDERVDILAKLSHSQRVIYPTIHCVDIAGLVRGASKGEGLGNKFLSYIGGVDLLLHVVRCFGESGVSHVDVEVDPVRDVETINLELILSDLQMVENILIKLKKQRAVGRDLLQLMEKVYDQLLLNRPLRAIGLSIDEQKTLAPYQFITSKPMLYIANCSESDVANPHGSKYYKTLVDSLHGGDVVITTCAKLECELSQLTRDEAIEYAQEYGINSSLDCILRAGYAKLGLISFLTTGEKETRSWSITKGTYAVDAAGKIHSDISKGFIRAEVVSYCEFVRYGGLHGARENGKSRTEGKLYVVQEGDVMLFYHKL